MPPCAPELRARLENYEIDDRARRRLRQMRSYILPVFDPIFDRVVSGAAKLPRVAELWQRHGKDLRRIERTQLEALLSGLFNQDYLDCCRDTARQERALGFEGRARMFCGASIIAAAPAVLKHSWRSSLVPELIAILSRALLLDQATTSTFDLDSVDAANQLRRKEIDAAIVDLDRTIRQVIAAIHDASARLGGASSIMEGLTQETVIRFSAASAASIEVARDANSTVAATEELSRSIQEIDRQTVGGLNMTRFAVTQTERTAAVIRSLAGAAEHVDSVIGLISKIAAQTNLLALNAAIEAARAGRLGKGFAVVANEVKSLASQTSRATEEISRQIATVQARTREAVDEMESIAKTINALSEVSTSIAAAIDEQSAAATSITRNVQTTADNVAFISAGMQLVEKKAKAAAGSANHVSDCTNELTTHAKELEQKVTRFFEQVRIR